MSWDSAWMGPWFGGWIGDAGDAPPPLTPSYYRRRFGLGLGTVVHRPTTRP